MKLAILVAALLLDLIVVISGHSKEFDSMAKAFSAAVDAGAVYVGFLMLAWVCLFAIDEILKEIFALLRLPFKNWSLFAWLEQRLGGWLLAPLVLFLVWEFFWVLSLVFGAFVALVLWLNALVATALAAIVHSHQIYHRFHNIVAWFSRSK